MRVINMNKAISQSQLLLTIILATCCLRRRPSRRSRSHGAEFQPDGAR